MLIFFLLAAAIDKVADRLTGPYNVDSVVEPLNIKISEAIMNFQEVGAEVSQKITQKCGSLGLKRPSRSAGYDNQEDNASMELKFETMKMSSNGKNRKHKKAQEKIDLTLEKLIEDIKIVSSFSRPIRWYLMAAWSSPAVPTV